ncbi:hypothetical protein [Candidatus Nephthysia bennettiae]|uniref:Uncharacterized protein n=1 Tax=Candidatus Nephthysia bennettiae TaxID=3127016 RepID=A0A934K6F0_9BACT|nr:hypothetical protein [Candidatus Dormibacteraeota bacterium]
MPRRPRGETHRVYLTLSKAEHSLLEAFARELARPPATVAGQILTAVLGQSHDEDQPIERHRVEAVVQALRGERAYDPKTTPLWRQPIELILAQRTWWDRCYPDLCKLLNRPPVSGPASQAPPLDREGYADLLEFLFPSIASPQGGATTWRSLNYPAVGQARNRHEGDRPLAATWAAVIRHVAVALAALEEVESPAALVLVEDQLRHGWLGTLLTLIGEGAPSDPPRLPLKPVV